MNEVITALLGRPYYSTVARGFIEEAIENSIADNGGKPFDTLDELDKHIRENYI